MKRRDFLKNSTLASTSLLLPQFLERFAPVGRRFGAKGRVLVVVQFSGGNDGLNTAVPYRNDLYYQNRPSLAIPAAEVLQVSDGMGFNPALAGLRDLYDQGLVSVLNSVGYPNPDRSHFRSMDIWHTASGSEEYLASGWLGRYLDSQCAGCESPHHAIEWDDSLSLALKGENRRGFALSDPQRLKKSTERPFHQAAVLEGPVAEDPNLAFLYKTLADTQTSAQYLAQQAGLKPSAATYPDTAFAKDLRQIAGLILADTDTRIYYLSLTGFDTHANQRRQQDRLLQQYAEGMKAFVGDLKQNGVLDEVLILTFSEFGRRVKQNASNGTDHGAASNVYLIGNGLKKPGFFNEAPNLADLDEGDLRHQIDFREVYATILGNWLEAPVSEILGGDWRGLDI